VSAASGSLRSGSASTPTLPLRPHRDSAVAPAIARFDASSGPPKPHFAYGALAKSDFALAHAFHIANHQDEIVIVTA